MGEFELIRQFFTRPGHPYGSGVVLGVGDDCALLQPAPGMQLAVSTDMLVAGRHFFSDVDPRTLGHKALAVNLSDLAACGARPLAFTLALALPDANPAWLGPFAEGLFALADSHGCALVGGDTTRGPLNICITVFGEVPVVDGRSQALLRSGAQAGDDVYVSGTLGDACLALQVLQGRLQLPESLLALARARLEQPSPRVALGIALRGLASAAADVSDGMLGDLGHILDSSGVGATIDTTSAIKLLSARKMLAGPGGEFDKYIGVDRGLQCVLGGGDDYELVFTAAPALRLAVESAGQSSGTAVTRIGHIDAQAGLRLVDRLGKVTDRTFSSFDHFAR
jgi:thiamine-monophosphate kinase